MYYSHDFLKKISGIKIKVCISFKKKEVFNDNR